MIINMQFELYDLYLALTPPTYPFFLLLSMAKLNDNCILTLQLFIEQHY